MALLLLAIMTILAPGSAQDFYTTTGPFLDRFGKMLGGNNRISVSPYLNHLSLDELYGFDDCAQKYQAMPEKYYTCFDAGSSSNE